MQRWVFAIVCLSLAVCRGQEGPLATFGTTVVIPGGLTGKIYHIPFGSVQLPNFDKLEPLGTIYARGLYIPPRDFTEGFPGITDRIEWFAIDFTADSTSPTPANTSSAFAPTTARNSISMASWRSTTTVLRPPCVNRILSR
jgi:hypothetical protein